MQRTVLGKILPKFKGAFVPDTIYNYLDIVIADNRTYIYINRISSKQISVDTADWALLCSAPVLTVGSVVTGDAGTDAAVELTPTDTGYALSFTIPKGDAGETQDVTGLTNIVETAVANGGINGATLLTGAINFNDYKTAGSCYYVTTTTTHLNAPPQAAASATTYYGGWLVILKGKTTNNVRQLYYLVTTSKFCVISRLYSNSTWGDWVTETDSPISFISTTGLNCNNYITNGAYAFTSTAVTNGTNFPTGATSGVLRVWGNNGTNFVQLYMDYNANAWLRRGSTVGGGSFNTWKKMTPPYAQTTAGVGQFLSFDVTAGNACTLPADGTWEYDVFAVNSSGAITGHKANVKAGGTQIFAADAGTSYFGHCKRVS